MENKYNEAMKKIEVTAEMEDRILNHLQKLDWEQPPNKVMRFPNYRKYLSLTACFIFLLAGSIMMYNFNRVQPEENPPPIMVTPAIAEYHTVEQLSKAVGFAMKEIMELPFIAKEIQYKSYSNELAEVVYQDAEHMAVLRMALGREDVSGDYGEYNQIKDVVVNGSSVTLKGNDRHYVLAIWQQDGYSYSVQFTEPVSEQLLLTTVESVR